MEVWLCEGEGPSGMRTVERAKGDVVMEMDGLIAVAWARRRLHITFITLLERCPLRCRPPNDRYTPKRHAYTETARNATPPIGARQ